MGNDGDIAYRLGHRMAFPSFGSAGGAMGLGDKEMAIRRTLRHFLFYQQPENGLARQSALQCSWPYNVLDPLKCGMSKIVKKEDPMIYEDPRFPNRKHKDLDQPALGGILEDANPQGANSEKTEAEELRLSGYKIISAAPELGEIPIAAEPQRPAPEATAAPFQAPAAEPVVPRLTFRQKTIERIRVLAQNPTKFYMYVGIGALVFFTVLFAAIFWLFGGTEGRYDLGTADSSAAGLTGHLYIEWEKDLDYRLTLSPSEAEQQAGFALAASSPPRPLSVEVHLQNSEGFVLCSKEILLRFDARKAAVLAAKLPGSLKRNADAAHPASDPSAPGIDFARLDAEEAARVSGKDVFQNQLGADGQIASINARGEIPCSKRAYEKTAAWSFTTNFPSIAEQNGLLDLQKEPQSSAAPPLSPPLPPHSPAARKKIVPVKLLPYTIEGDDAIVDFDFSQGVITTRGRKSFLIDKAAAADPAWQDYPVSIHYRCDQSSACILAHSGLGSLRVRMRR
jgi:hypothetical protein